MNSTISPIHLKFTTPHYTFKLMVTRTLYPLHKITFITGSNDKPCLEGILILENNSKNNRFDSMVNTAKLIKIDALQECSLEDITDEYMATYSFGTELLNAIVFLINSQCPEIETISLNDASYIPCIRDSKDTLDLLIYSIALYKHTWYEQKLGAYIKPKEKYEAYRQQVELYGSKERKNRMEFVDMYKLILHASEFTKDLFEKNYSDFEQIFMVSETLPDFFRILSRKIKRTDRCRFFKDWLETFIQSEVHIERTWYIDMYPKIEVIQNGGFRHKNLTRKIKRYKL